MPFPLSKIELHLDDELIARAELMLEDGSLSGVATPEPGLWLATTRAEESLFEVEALLKKNQVSAHTCECGQSNKKEYCVHVVALLLYILNLQKEKKEAKPKIIEEKTPKRITISYVLDLVQPNDLKQFVRDYASQDRHFDLLLKAHFAHLLPRTADREPIGEALANTIKAIKKPGKSLSRNDWKMFQKVLDTLLQQAEDALFKKHYADAFETAEAILEQLSPMLLMTEDRKILKEAIVKALLLLEELSETNLAPELENNMWLLCLSQSDKQVYYFYDLWLPLGQLLIKLAKTKERSAMLLEIFDQKSKDNYVLKNNAISAGLVHFKIQLFELQHNEAALRRYLEENIHHPEVLSQAIQLATKTANWPQLEQLCLFALHNTNEEDSAVELNDQLLQAFVQQKKKKKAQKLALELFLLTFDLNYFNKLKELSGRNWLEIRSLLLESAKTLPTRIEHQKTLAQIYSLEKMYNDLRALLQTCLSIDLLAAHDLALFQQDNYNTGLLYKEIYDHYLENYMGKPAALKIRDSLQHLKSIGQHELAKQLESFVRAKYGDRGSIIEVLNEG